MGLRIAALALSLAAPLATSALEAAPPRTITVSGDAEVKVAPDEVTIRLGVETYDPKLAAAKRENDEQIKRIIAAARGAGLEEKRIATDQVSYEPQFASSDSWKKGRPTLYGYTVRRSLELTLRDVSRFDAVLTAVLEAGANYVHGIDFRTTELRRHRDQARSLAMKAAQEKAVALARELGMKPGRARSVSEGFGGFWSSYGRWGGYGRGGGMSQNVTQNAGGDSAVAGTLAPGMISVTASVTIVFDLE